MKKAIWRKRLLKRARKFAKRDVDNLSNKALLKIVNRHNIANKLRRVFSSLGKRTSFTNSELDSAIVLDDLTTNELNKLAKKLLIRNYDILSKDQLYYALITTKETPLEDNFIKYMNRDFRNDLKLRINHALFLITKLENKVTNVQRKEIISELKKITWKIC